MKYYFIELIDNACFLTWYKLKISETWKFWNVKNCMEMTILSVSVIFSILLKILVNQPLATNQIS